jgi:hypothetical protein
MGMYTEVFARLELRRDAPQWLFDLLREVVDEGESANLPDDPFFALPRWSSVFNGGSAYFQSAPNSSFEMGRAEAWAEGPTLVAHGNLKNYDGEIDAFFKWITQYSAEVEGAFIGWSLYEEVEPFTGPNLYYSGSPA